MRVVSTLLEFERRVQCSQRSGGDCQEPWTRRNGKMRSAPALETRGRWSLLRAAGSTTQDKLARGTARYCCYTFVAICKSLEEWRSAIPIEGVSANIGTAL